MITNFFSCTLGFGQTDLNIFEEQLLESGIKYSVTINKNNSVTYRGFCEDPDSLQNILFDAVMSDEQFLVGYEFDKNRIWEMKRFFDLRKIPYKVKLDSGNACFDVCATPLNHKSIDSALAGYGFACGEVLD